MAAIGLTEYTARLQGAPRAISEQLAAIMLRTADVGEAELRGNIASRLTVRSRSLLTSARVDVVETDDTLTLTMAAGGDYQGLRVRYARLQELGGVVVPRTARMLAIPQEPALTGPGVPKYPSARLAPYLVLVQRTRDGYRVSARGGEALDNVESITSRIKGEVKGLCLVHRLTGEIWYRLVYKVTIKAKYFLRDAGKVTGERLAAALAEPVVMEPTA